MADPEYLRLLHLIDQDRANCEAWWVESSDEEKIAVWNCIQKTYTDPAMEVMSRFAQLCFSEMAEKHERP